MQNICPYKEEVVNRICYRNRKCPGSTNDILAWELSKIKREVIDSGLLPDKYYFISDEALQCTESVLTPFGGKGLGHWIRSLERFF
jgi:hypothetical protein